MPNLGIRNASIMPFFRFSGWLKRFITKISVTQQPSGIYRSWHMSKLYKSLYLKALFAFFNLVMEDFHPSNSFIYMCQGDHERNNFYRTLCGSTAFNFSWLIIQGQKESLHIFLTWNPSTKFSQSQRNKFHCDPASMASLSFLLSLLSSSPCVLKHLFQVTR